MGDSAGHSSTLAKETEKELATIQSDVSKNKAATAMLDDTSDAGPCPCRRHPRPHLLPRHRHLLCGRGRSSSQGCRVWR